MSGVAEIELQRHKLTVADYHRMGDAGVFEPEARVELVEGEIIDMAPIGSRHAGTVIRLVRCLRTIDPRSAVLSPQNPVIVDEHTELEPDAALLRPREDDYRTDHPRPRDVLVIIEVCDTSLRYDREVKVPLYARAGIPEVWLVDLNSSVLHVHRRPGSEGYQDVRAIADPGELDLAALPGLRVDLSGLF